MFKRLRPTQGRELPLRGKLSRPDHPLAHPTHPKYVKTFI